MEQFIQSDQLLPLSQFEGQLEYSLYVFPCCVMLYNCAAFVVQQRMPFLKFWGREWWKIGSQTIRGYPVDAAGYLMWCGTQHTPTCQDAFCDSQNTVWKVWAVAFWRFKMCWHFTESGLRGSNEHENKLNNNSKKCWFDIFFCNAVYTIIRTRTRQLGLHG